MKRYLLVEVVGENGEKESEDVCIKYFDDLVNLYSYVCHELMYDELGIEDFLYDPYSGVEERIEEHESSYYIFDGEKEIFSFVIGHIVYGDWVRFENLCHSKTNKIIENKILRFDLFEGKKDRFPDIRKIDADGFLIYVGRDAKSNDYLTFNIAEPDDIWMHVKGVPGSHVVIRVSENLPTLDIIKYAAGLAKKNSKSPKDDKATVVYCKRKFVKKEKGMNDGQVRVDYVNADEIII